MKYCHQTCNMAIFFHLFVCYPAASVLLGNELKRLNGGNDELKQQLWEKYDEKASQLGWDTIREQ